MDNKIKVLITGAGAPGGPGIIKALKGVDYLEIHSADMDSYAVGQFLSDFFHVIPAADSQNFIDFIFDLCKKEEISCLFPLVTKELFKFSDNKKRFEKAGVKIVVSSPEALFLSNNKCKLYRHLKENKINLPRFHEVDNIESLKDACYDLGYPKKNVVLKPCISNGSRGVRILTQNQNLFDSFFSEKPNSLFSNLEDITAIFGKHHLPKLLISEYLPGAEFTIDTIISQGTILEILVRSREKIREGISISGKFVHKPEIERYINQIVESIPGLIGPIGFQLKADDSGEFKLLECNPRIQGTSVAGLGCGVNLPLISVLSTLGLELPKYQKKLNIGFLRHYSEIFYEY